MPIRAGVTSRAVARKVRTERCRHRPRERARVRIAFGGVSSKRSSDHRLDLRRQLRPPVPAGWQAGQRCEKQGSECVDTATDVNRTVLELFGRSKGRLGML